MNRLFVYAIGLLFVSVSLSFASLLEVDDAFVDGLVDGQTPVGFVYGGTVNDGILFYGDSDAVAVTVSDSVDTWTCRQQVTGLYYANTRGKRLWPLDMPTLNVLQTRDSSYTGLSLIGGWYYDCDGQDTSSVYGQIVYSWSGTETTLIAGVGYDYVSDTVIGSGVFDQTLDFVVDQGFDGHFRDSVGGVGGVSTDFDDMPPVLVTGGSGSPDTLSSSRDTETDNGFVGSGEVVDIVESGDDVLLSCVDDTLLALWGGELVDAYRFAFETGITTMCPIDDANLLTPIRRHELAKMMTVFAEDVLDQSVGRYDDRCFGYDDVGDLSDEMRGFVQRVCQLEIMGMETNGMTPMSSFAPYQLVTRAEFGVVLSRVLFGREFDGNTSNRYEDHLANLYDTDIMTVQYDDPTNVVEMRGYVMLMLRRVSTMLRDY